MTTPTTMIGAVIGAVEGGRAAASMLIVAWAIGASVQAAPPATEAGSEPAPTTPRLRPVPEAVRVANAALLATVADGDDPIPSLPRKKWFRHKMVARERVEQVAYRYGIERAELSEWNGLETDADRLRRGTRLRVFTERVPPHRETIDYTVVEDDTWWSIALRHGVDTKDLRAYNYPYRDKMTPGSQLVIVVDPVVRDWIATGPDPLAPDRAHELRRGGVSIGRPDAGWLLNGVRIPDGEGYHLRLPKSAYGTTHAVAQVMAALATFRATTHYDDELEIGAMSRPRGGPLGGHKSHQSGRDLDIRLPRRKGIPSWYTLKLSRVDWYATWQLVDAFRRTDVQVIFLDYAAQKRLYKAALAMGVDEATLHEVLQVPDGRGTSGLVRDEPGHDKHLHVRVGCGPYDVECVP